MLILDKCQRCQEMKRMRVAVEVRAHERREGDDILGEYLIYGKIIVLQLFKIF